MTIPRGAMALESRHKWMQDDSHGIVERYSVFALVYSTLAVLKLILSTWVKSAIWFLFFCPLLTLSCWSSWIEGQWVEFVLKSCVVCLVGLDIIGDQ